MGSEDIVNCLYQHPASAFKLICFPWAGSGSIYFAEWGKFFHHSIEVSSIRFSGRESRVKEPFARDMEDIVVEMSNVLQPLLQDIPFAFFGHSMGAHVAFMTALYLKENYNLQPMHIFLSSANPPHTNRYFRPPNVYDLPEDELIQLVSSVGGTPKEILENKEIMGNFLPVLKADVQIMRNFNFVKPSKILLSCDITCFSGTEDITKEMEDWKDLTTGSMNCYTFPGDHFYLTDPSNEAFLINYITKCLEVTHLA